MSNIYDSFPEHICSDGYPDGGDGSDCPNCDNVKCIGCVFRDPDHVCVEDCPNCGVGPLGEYRGQ